MTNFTVAITASREQAHDERTRALAPVVHRWQGDASGIEEAVLMAREEFERETGFSEYTVAAMCPTDELEDDEPDEYDGYDFSDARVAQAMGEAVGPDNEPS